MSGLVSGFFLGWDHQLCCAEVRLIHSRQPYWTTVRIHIMARTNQLSKEKRVAIITLTNEGQSVRKIAKTLNVSPSAVAKTIKHYNETGSHEDRPRKGRPRVTSAAEDKFIRVTSLRNRRLTAAQIRDQLNATQSSSSRHISRTNV